MSYNELVTVVAIVTFVFILVFVGVNDSSVSFLQYLDKQNIALGAVIQIIEKENFDNSLKLKINNSEIVISQLISNNIFVK